MPILGAGQRLSERLDITTDRPTDRDRQRDRYRQLQYPFLARRSDSASPPTPCTTDRQSQLQYLFFCGAAIERETVHHQRLAAYKGLSTAWRAVILDLLFELTGPPASLLCRREGIRASLCRKTTRSTMLDILLKVMRDSWQQRMVE